MRRRWLMLLGFMAISGIAFSQGRNDFKGPQAKNYKAWQHSVETTDVSIVANQAEVVKGPQSKNKINSLLSTTKEEATSVTTANILNNPRLGMVGPKAKNYKIGRR